MYDVKQLLKRDNKNYRICGIGKNGQKLIKDDKNFIELTDFMKKLKPTKDDINRIKFSKSNNKTLIKKLIELKGIKDKLIIKMIGEYGKLNNYKPVPHIISKMCIDNKEIKEFIVRDDKFSSYIDVQYPLLSNLLHIDSNLNPELEIYINAKNKKGA